MSKDNINENLCVICRSNESDIYLVPCLHLTYCDSCFDLLEDKKMRCPLCRTEVFSVDNKNNIKKIIKKNIIEKIIENTENEIKNKFSDKLLKDELYLEKIKNNIEIKINNKLFHDQIKYKINNFIEKLIEERINEKISKINFEKHISEEFNIYITNFFEYNKNKILNKPNPPDNNWRTNLIDLPPTINIINNDGEDDLLIKKYFENFSITGK